MIELCSETLIPIREAPRHLPKRPTGKRIHISACYRWISRGVQGVRLEAIKIGGSTYTSTEALQRFAGRLSARMSSDQPLEDLPARRREIDLATKQLRSLLGSPGTKPQSDRS